MWRRIKNKIGRVPFFSVALVALAVMVNAIIAALILRYAKHLGWFFMPVLLGYMTLLILVFALIVRRRELGWIRANLGDELFFEKYPREKKREERIKRRAEKKALGQQARKH